MLNYIWAGLIIASLVFALATDFKDLGRDTFRNGEALPVSMDFAAPFEANAERQAVTLRIDSTQYKAFYGTDAVPDTAYAATLRHGESGYELRLDDAEADLPAPLDRIRDTTNPNDKLLQGEASGLRVQADGLVASAALTFAPVRFTKLGDISTAALDFAETAATLALGLIGVLVLFLGLTQIAADAGIIHSLVKLVRPILGPLFPDIPPDHPAMGMIALNLAANVFGLGNAATPFGIKAMEELQTLNPEKDTATDSMVMLLAMNTASVQLVPPVLLIAIIGLEINKVYFAIVLTTMGSLTVAIIATKLLGRLRRYRDSNPLRNGAAVPSETPAAE